MPYSKNLQWDPDLEWKWWTVQANVVQEHTSQGEDIAENIEEALSLHIGVHEWAKSWLQEDIYPTDGELGGLASVVYQKDGGYAFLNALSQQQEESKEKLELLKSLGLKDWQLVGMASNSGKTNGYVGGIYWQPNRRHLVIAHRGTDPNNLGAIWTDFKGIFGNDYVSQMNSATTFSNIVVETLRELSNGNKIMPILSFTGHSLGGWLSQVTTFTTEYLEFDGQCFKKRENFYYHPHTVVWDSPGCEPMLSQLKIDFDYRYADADTLTKLSLNALDIKSYLSKPNQINTCNLHTGLIYQLFPTTKLTPEELNQAKSWWSNLEKIIKSYVEKNTILYTLKTHKLDGLLEAYPKVEKDRADKDKVQRVKDWPIRSGIRGGEEYEKFFEVILQLDDYRKEEPKSERAKEIEKMLESVNCRYGLKPVDLSEADMRIFSPKERYFLELMQALQTWLEKEHNKDFSKLMKLNDFLKEKLVDSDIETIKKAFKAYSLEKNARLLKAQEANALVEPVIRGIKQLLRRYPEIVDIAWKEVESRPTLSEVVYASESNRIIRELEEFDLHWMVNREKLGLVDFLTGSQAILHIQTDSSTEVMMFGQLGLDILAAIKGKDNLLKLSQDERNILNKFYGEKGISFLSIQMVRAQEEMQEGFNLQSFYKKDSTTPLLWLDGRSELTNKDKKWIGKLFKAPSEKKKIVLVTKETNQTNEILKQYLQNMDENTYRLCKPEKLTWTELTDESKQRVLETKVLFQEQPISLNKLITTDSVVAAYLPLVDLLAGNPVKIGKPLPVSEGYDKDFYIGRTFNRLVSIKPEIFEDIKDKKFPDLVVESEQDFSQDSQNFNENTHWLQQEHDQWIWQQTRGSLNNIRQYIGNTIKSYPPEDLAAFLQQAIEQRLMLIADTAGMGKSTVLTHLSQAIKQAETPHWVIRIDLNDHTDTLKSQKELCFTTDSAFQFLADQLLKLKENTIEKSLLTQCFQPGATVKLAILLDGFDEISPNYKDIVISLLKALKETAIEQLWVTTRPHLKETLENALQQFSYTLEPFNEDNQIDFLVEFWTKKLKGTENECIDESLLRTYAAQLVCKLANSIGDRAREFTGIPLQVRLLAESFQPSGQTTPALPDKIGLSKLYQDFIEKKENIYIQDKAKISKSVPAAENLIECTLENIKRQHQQLALKLILSEQTGHTWQPPTDSLPSNKENNEKLCSIGLAQINEEGQPHFIHRTFAEYYVADFFTQQITSEQTNAQAIDFLFTSILLKSDYQVVRAFLNDRLDEDTINSSLNTLLRTQGERIYELCRSLLGDRSDLNGYTSLHIAILENNLHIINFLFAALKDKQEDLQSLLHIKGRYDGNTPLQLAVEQDQLAVVTTLLDKGATANVSDKYHRTPLQVAAANGYQEVFTVLVTALKAEGNVAAEVNARDADERTPLLFAAENGSFKIVEVLLNVHGIEVNAADRHENTPLHLAAKKGYLRIVESLLNAKDININAKNKYHRTPLQVAAANGYQEVFTVLVTALKAQGYVAAEVNAGDADGRTPLHLAAKNGHLKIVEELLNVHGIEVNAIDAYGRTPLHLAAENGTLEIVEELLNVHGIEVNAADKDHDTPLHLAATKGHLKIVESLLNAKDININAKNKYHRTPLQVAAANGYQEVFTFLVTALKAQGNVAAEVNAGDANGSTPLHLATEIGHLKIVEELLNVHGIEVNAADKLENTPLHLAAENGSLKVVESLLNAKDININAKNIDHRTPLHSAAAMGHQEVFTVLVTALKDQDKVAAEVNARDAGGRSPLHFAAENGSLEIVEVLLNVHGIEVNAADEDKNTPLHLAANKGHIKIVEYLLNANDININAKNTDHRAPLHWAAANGHQEVFTVLVTALNAQGNIAAEVNARDADGRTPLHYAAEKGSLKIVEELLNVHGIEFNAADRHENTPLHLAAKKGYLRIVESLLNAKDINISAKNIYHRTPLHWAAGMGHQEVFTVLVTALNAQGNIAAEVNARDADGRTPLHYAAENGSLGIVEELLNVHGIEVNAADEDNDTPLHLAAKKGYLKIVESLLNAKDININAKNKYHRTPLHWAAAMGHQAVVQQLLDKHASFNEVDDLNTTPLKLATLKSNWNIAVMLWRHGAETTGLDLEEKQGLLNALSEMKVEDLEAFKERFELLRAQVSTDNFRLASDQIHFT